MLYSTVDGECRYLKHKSLIAPRVICAIAVPCGGGGGGEAHSPATLSRPDLPETIANCRNDGVKSGRPRSVPSPRTFDICVQRDSATF